MTTVTPRPEQRSLADALRTLDSLGALLDLLCAKQKKRATAIKVRTSEERNGFDVFVTCDDRTDEERVGRAVLLALGDMQTQADEHRAALIRAVLREQWRAMITVRIMCALDNVDGGTPHALSESPVVGVLWPCAVDVVDDMLGDGS